MAAFTNPNKPDPACGLLLGAGGPGGRALLSSLGSGGAAAWIVLDGQPASGA